jgi:histidyl-tRNA synthetase
MISRVKGTHDFLDLRLFNFVERVIGQQAEQYHFKEIATPILEHTDLFKRSLGLQTDVVSKEMFIIGDPTREDSICLRPEATAPTMRTFLEHKEQLVTPWKVYSLGSMFRHERPQKGRFRQFHQATFEVIGSGSVAQDVHLITMLDRLFQEKFTLDTYALLVNFLGCFEDRQQFKKILYDFLSSVQNKICADCIVRKEHNIMRVFDCKVPTCKELYTNAPRIADNLCKTCQVEWQQLQDQLHLLSISFSYSPYLVRGLDYYDKTVFEFTSDNLGSQTAFCGGGRYNRLATHLGAAEDSACVGASIGIERLLLLLEPVMDRLQLPTESPLTIIMPMGMEQQPLALLLADELHAHNLCVDIFLEGDSLKSMMRKANKMGAAHVLIIGSNEQAARKVMIKKMVTGHEELVDQTTVAAYLKN